MRAYQSRPIQERLWRALVRLKTVQQSLPQSLFGRAIEYALSQWPTLGPWLEDGRLEIGNNRVENAIRPKAVGKKNWLFVGDADAGQRRDPYAGRIPAEENLRVVVHGAAGGSFGGGGRQSFHR